MGPESKCEFFKYVQKSHLLKNQIKCRTQLHPSGSFIHVVLLCLTRAITYKLRWKCDVLLELTDFQDLAYNIHVGLLTLNPFTVLCGTKGSLQLGEKSF